MSKLHGLEVLIVEDEPLIALEVAHAFREVGANVTTTGTLKQATTLIEHDGLGLVILDQALRDGDADVLREKLRGRNVPFVIYSGLVEPSTKVDGGAVIAKPVTPDVLLAVAEGLLDSRSGDSGAALSYASPRAAPEPD